MAARRAPRAIPTAPSECQTCNSAQTFPQSGDKPLGSGSRLVDRRMFLAGATAAVLAVACGSNNESASPLEEATRSSSPSPAPTAAPTTVPATTAAKSAGPAEWVVSGPTSPDRVALTFHTDGDLGLADQLLATLKSRDVVMTSFIVGEWLAANPTYAKKISDAGHELANHTYTHPTFGSLSAAAMTDEITRSRDLLIRLTGQGGRFFRPSGTADGTQRPSATVLEVTATAGYAVALGFDVDPLDYNQPGADVVTQRTLDQVKAGSIISLHFDYPGTIAALPKILDGLAARQLTPVTVAQLLGR
jgi:peptidoglycan/xylan/chitin deacetylase (PgdA/CDA1 family)